MCKICDTIILIEKYEKLKKLFNLKGRIESNCSWKRAIHLNKRAYLFHKRALG